MISDSECTIITKEVVANLGNILKRNTSIMTELISLTLAGPASEMTRAHH